MDGTMFVSGRYFTQGLQRDIWPRAVKSFRHLLLRINKIINPNSEPLTVLFSFRMPPSDVSDTSIVLARKDSWIGSLIQIELVNKHEGH